jgi:hypothetical protein
VQIFEKHKDLRAVVLDFVDVKHADLSGLFAMKEVMDHAKKSKLGVFLANVLPDVQALLTKSEIAGDDINKCSSELRDAVLAAQAVAGNPVMSESLDVESLGMVTGLLKTSKAQSLLELAQWSAAKERGIELQEVRADSLNAEEHDSLMRPIALEVVQRDRPDIAEEDVDRDDLES